MQKALLLYGDEVPYGCKQIVVCRIVSISGDIYTYTEPLILKEGAIISYISTEGLRAHPSLVVDMANWRTGDDDCGSVL